MGLDKFSGQAPFVFAHRADLSRVPAAAVDYEVHLHGGFARDDRPGFGQVYYGMPGCGLVRLEANLQTQDIIALPADLQPLNFHGTSLGQFDGQWRLFLPANDAEKVVVLTLEGELDFVLPRPVFDEYRDQSLPYKPTATALVGSQLFVADGYGSNYISSANVTTRQWTAIFGGRTDDPAENGKFRTAHGINFNPVHHHLDIADRPHSRVQAHATDGAFVASHKLPAGAFVCGIHYFRLEARWYGVIACLVDAEPGRAAPVYIIDAESYELLSIVRPKDELGIELAQHLHNAVVQVHAGQVFLVCQAWNPGHYFVLQMV